MFDSFGNNDGENDVDISFKDVITLILMGITVIFIIILMHVNPKGSDSNKAITQPGRISFEVHWDPAQNIDVDMWVKHETQDSIGYSRKDSATLNLVRDDLGIYNDPTPINYENAFARSLVPGEYIVNLQLYAINDGALPVIATVYVRIEMGDPAATTTTIVRNLSEIVKLTANKEEVTAIRFTIDEDGFLMPDSINRDFVSIRGNIQPTPNLTSVDE